VRGMVSNPHAHAESRNGKLNVRGVVGTSGYLSVTRDTGEREPYRGMVELVSGEIGEDLAYYLAQSEQTPSGVGIGVFVRPDRGVEAAGGYLIQLLPGVPDDEVAALERRAAELPHPTELIRAGTTPERMLGALFPEGFELLERQPIAFHCPCSRERFEGAIVSLGEAEVRRIIDEEREPFTEVVCHFCNESYRFSPDEMATILRNAR
jgi:molecular chaperone Hsp33